MVRGVVFNDTVQDSGDKRCTEGSKCDSNTRVRGGRQGLIYLFEPFCDVGAVLTSEWQSRGRDILAWNRNPSGTSGHCALASLTSYRSYCNDHVNDGEVSQPL